MKQFRRSIFALLAALIAISLLAAGCGSSQKQGNQPSQQGQKEQAGTAKEPIKIGAVLDITGPGSSLGVPERNTLKLVEEQVNAAGGINGRPLKFVILDNESDETKSVLAFKKLLEEEKVAAVIGAAMSGTTLAMVDSAEKFKIPLVSNAASIQIVTPIEKRRWIFKTTQSDALVVSKLIDYFKAKGYKKIAFLGVNNAFGDGGRVQFEAQAAKAGLQIVAKEKFGATDSDMTSQLTKVKAASPDAVLVWAIPPAASVVTRNYRQLGIEAPLFHSHGIANKTFIDQVGEAADGVIFPIGKLLVAEQLPDSDPQKATLLKYAKDYEAKYGPRSAFGGIAWDSANLLIQAISKVGQDPAQIRDELEATKNFVGISGVFNFTTQDHNGLDANSLIFVKIENGKWKLIQ